MSRGTDWDYLLPLLWEALADTAVMVGSALAVAAVVGLALGVGLYVTRRGGLRANRVVFTTENALINLVRPIPFVIFVTAIAPLTIALGGSRIGREAAILPMGIMASVAFARLVEQTLVALDPGVVEAARAMGASRWRIVWSVLVPEALGPLILAFTFGLTALVFLAGAGGLGDFAIRHGYQRFNWTVAWVTVGLIVVLVQAVQLAGNVLARKALRR